MAFNMADRRFRRAPGSKLLPLNLLLVLTVLSFTAAAWAQPAQVGGLFYVQGEPGDSGNGAIAGAELQAVLHFQIAEKEFRFLEQASITKDLKKYLGEYGTAIRTLSLVRADIKNGAFVQGGVKVSGVNYSGPGGYGKWGVVPVVGGGVTVTPRQGDSVTFGYLYLFRSKLYGQKALFDSTGRILDGWTSGHQIQTEYSHAFKPKWLILVNFNAGQTTYQRNPAEYGAALGAIKHRSASLELSVGIARKLTKN